jgi:hypothetical protein
MPRESAITFGDLIGKIDVPRIECAPNSSRATVL